MDAFTLSFSYGINKLSKKTIVITSILTGIFHFIMPILGNILGITLFEYTIIKPKYILFTIFLIISLDMLINFFNDDIKLRVLNIIGIIIFAFSVSFDSFSVGFGLNYFYNNILLSSLIFSLISTFFTFFGFILGKFISEKIGRFAFLLGSFILFVYSLILLT